MRQTRSQTSLSMSAGKLGSPDDYHHVKVQHAPHGDWESPIESYLDKASPSAAARGELVPMYKIVEDGKTPESRLLTGSSKMSLLRCSREDFLLEQEANAAAAGARLKADATSGMGANEKTELTGGALSID